MALAPILIEALDRPVIDDAHYNEILDAVEQMVPDDIDAWIKHASTAKQKQALSDLNVRLMATPRWHAVMKRWNDSGQQAAYTARKRAEHAAKEAAKAEAEAARLRAEEAEQRALAAEAETLHRRGEP